MKRTLFVVLALALSVTAFAADEPAEKADDTQDVLYLGEGRPALLRLHLQIDNKPVFERWDAFMNRVFAFLDRNTNNFLDRVEGSKAPNAQQMLQFLQGDIASIRGRRFDPSVSFEQLDPDRDGKVMFEEFCAYYRANGAGPVQVATPGVNAGRQDSLTDIVFGILDRDKDGKLSSEELAQAEPLFGRYDTDDDELVSTGELGYQPPQAQQRQVVVEGTAPKQEEPNTKMMLVPRDDGRRRTGRLQLVRDIVAKLDKDKSGKLSQPESGFQKAGFDKLDRNKDGLLDVLELSRWISGKPDGEFTVKLGPGRTAAMARTQAARAAQGKGGRAKPPGATAREEMSVKLENVRLMVTPLNAGVPRLGALTQLLVRQFQVADKDKRGYLIKKQVDANQFFYVASLFDIADRNNDGKLTVEELREFGDLYKEAYGAQMSLSLATAGLGMFQTLDANQDGQLGIRELRTGWERLKEFDRDGDGQVAKSEFPQQFTLNVGSGVNPNNLPASVLRNSMPRTARRVPGQGPMWFRKMDRNGDGDVSRVEWLGSQDEFARIDLDKDGLISTPEAEAADTRARKKAD
jgi:Ca2+-binding EF-hand superfamily protein